jgi:hypothetical protein
VTPFFTDNTSRNAAINSVAYPLTTLHTMTWMHQAAMRGVKARIPHMYNRCCASLSQATLDAVFV